MENIKSDYKSLRKQFIIEYSAVSDNRYYIYKRDKFKCAYCGIEVIDIKKFFDLVDKRQQEELNKLENDLISPEEYENFNARNELEKSDEYKKRMATIDHIIPLVKGGNNDKTNLITCCKNCNSKKKDNIQLENGYTKIANELLEKYAKLKISGTCWQVLIAIIRKLYGFNKKEDWIEYSQLMSITNLPKSRISHSMKQLREYGIVTQKRDGIKQIISINKNYNVMQKYNSYINEDNSSMFVEPTVTQTRTTKEIIQKKKNTKETSGYNPLGAEIIKLFEGLNPACKRMYGNTTQRQACDDLIDTYGFEEVSKVINILPRTNKLPYFPNITTPDQLWKKYQNLKVKLEQKKEEIISKKPKVAF